MLGMVQSELENRVVQTITEIYLWKRAGNHEDNIQVGIAFVRK